MSAVSSAILGDLGSVALIESRSVFSYCVNLSGI